MFNDRIKEEFYVRTYHISQIEKLKAKYGIKMIDDEKNIHQDICYGNLRNLRNLLMLLILHGQKRKRKERLVKYITKQREEMSIISNNSRICF